MKFLLEILSTFYATGFTGPHRDNKRTKMIEILPTKCHFLLKEREKVSFFYSNFLWKVRIFCLMKILYELFIGPRYACMALTPWKSKYFRLDSIEKRFPVITEMSSATQTENFSLLIKMFYGPTNFLERISLKLTCSTSVISLPEITQPGINGPEPVLVS